MRNKVRLYRLGWKEAHRLIKDKGYQLSKFEDGHAEVISPIKTIPHFGRRGACTSSREGGCAEGYLTAGSVEILLAVVKAEKQKREQK